MKFLPEVKAEIAILKSEIIEKCTKCDGTVFIPVRPGAVARCDCMLVFRYLKDLVKAQIPKDYWTLTIDICLIHLQSINC